MVPGQHLVISMRFGIIRSPYKPLAEAFIEKIMACIHSVGAAAVPFYPDNGIPEVDMIISIGGDGTMLAAARQVKEIPILGINLGHLGFLTNIEFDCCKEKESFAQLRQAILRIAHGQYQIDQRCRIEPVVRRKNAEIACCTALNDVVIKGAIAKLVRLQLFIGEEYVGNFPADGIIISTATGSTGYSLSCGGPIIPPDTDVNIVTPISSHLLTARPLVACNNKEIKINNGIGYIEKDYGSSFPKTYLWIQCNDFQNEKASIMVSIADIPLLGYEFKGCIAAILYKGKEYRMATYNGVKIIDYNKKGLTIKRGRYKLHIDIEDNNAKKLLAPNKGEMERVIYEAIACSGRFRFHKKDKLIFDLKSNNTSFEYVN